MKARVGGNDRGRNGKSLNSGNKGMTGLSGPVKKDGANRSDYEAGVANKKAQRGLSGLMSGAG